MKNQTPARKTWKSPEDEVPGRFEISHLPATLGDMSGRDGRNRQFFRRFPETPRKLMMPKQK
jgi:hypothetical protein